jgi:Mn2+/Fe2+ NRAMP family transporter
MMSANDDGKLIDVYLEEYKSLRAEVLSRIQTQNQAVNFLLIIMGAAITATIAVLRDVQSASYLSSVILAIILLLPLFAAPLCFIFFDNEIMIHAIGSYLFYEVRPRIAKITKSLDTLGDILEFKHLPFTTSRVFHHVSLGRWILFIIPILLPTAFSIAYSSANWGWWRNYHSPIPKAQPINGIFLVIIIVANCAVSTLLIFVMFWLRRNRQYQQRKKQIWISRWQLRRRKIHEIISTQRGFDYR